MSREDIKSIGMLLLVALLAVVFTFGDQIMAAVSEMTVEQAGSMMDQLLR